MTARGITRALKIVLGILIAVVVIGAVGEGVQQLWNWLLPSLFGWRQINFWQGLGLLALCRILFGGLGSHRSGRPNFRGRMRERCGKMTPEERERFRQAMRERWGFGPSPSEGEGR